MKKRGVYAALFFACEVPISGKLPVRSPSLASQLPQVSNVNAGFVNATDHCGSGLARDEACPDSASSGSAT
jgi:hypothetical protein